MLHGWYNAQAICSRCFLSTLAFELKPHNSYLSAHTPYKGISPSRSLGGRCLLGVAACLFSLFSSFLLSRLVLEWIFLGLCLFRFCNSLIQFKIGLRKYKGSRGTQKNKTKGLNSGVINFLFLSSFPIQN